MDGTSAFFSFARASSVQSSATPWELGNENQQQHDTFISEVFIIKKKKKFKKNTFLKLFSIGKYAFHNVDW